MTTTYILIDYENVQPKDLAFLNGHPFKIIVFIGANQKKIVTEFAIALQPRGDNARYVRISGNGKNALDFHIAAYLSELAAKDPSGSYYVISKDKGFDPLIAHLQARDLRTQRATALAELPILASSGYETLNQQLEFVITNLRKRGPSRPRKRKTLESSISALFQTRLAEPDIRKITDALVKRGVIEIQGEAVTYPE